MLQGRCTSTSWRDCHGQKSVWSLRNQQTDQGWYDVNRCDWKNAVLNGQFERYSKHFKEFVNLSFFCTNPMVVIWVLLASVPCYWSVIGCCFVYRVWSLFASLLVSLVFIVVIVIVIIVVVVIVVIVVIIITIISIIIVAPVMSLIYSFPSLVSGANWFLVGTSLRSIGFYGPYVGTCKVRPRNHRMACMPYAIWYPWSFCFEHCSIVAFWNSSRRSKKTAQILWTYMTFLLASQRPISWACMLQAWVHCMLAVVTFWSCQENAVTWMQKSEYFVCFLWGQELECKFL